MVVDLSGNLFVADTYNNAIRFIKKQTGIITTIAGSTIGAYGSSGDGLASVGATLNFPGGLTLDTVNHLLYIADTGNNKIRVITLSTGVITTFAGTGDVGSTGDGYSALYALLSHPNGVASDLSGNGVLFIADSGNYRIRKVGSNGIISTFAGGGMYSPGDGLKAIYVTLYQPTGVATDIQGNVYIASAGGDKIQKVNSTGILTTFAGVGTPVTGGVTGDGNLAVDAHLSYPSGLAVDGSGNVFIADSMNNAIRFVAHDTGIITTFAGVGGTSGYMGMGPVGDGGLATSAYLSYPTAVAVDPVSGTVYIADSSNNRIRAVTISYNFPTGQPSKQPTSEPSKFVWHPKQTVRFYIA